MDASNLFNIKHALSVLDILNVVLAFTFLTLLGCELRRILISEMELGLRLLVDIQASLTCRILVRSLNLLAEIMEHGLKLIKFKMTGYHEAQIIVLFQKLF